MNNYQKISKIVENSTDFRATQVVVADKLNDDFNKKHLAEISFPDIQLAAISEKEQVPYMVFGDPDAQKLVFVVTPYGDANAIDVPSQMVRMTAQQEILGDEYCVVGLHVEDSAGMKLSRQQRKKVADGDFEPFADRTLAVIEAVGPHDDQEVYFYGYSKGADVAVETAHKLATSEYGGIVDVDGLAAIEMARTKNAGALAVASSFAGSGKDLHANVVAANSPALLEARGIDLADSKAEKKHNNAVVKKVLIDYLRDPMGAIANMKGFGTDTSVRQVKDLATRQQLPKKTVIGRANQSTLFAENAFYDLAGQDGVTAFGLDGDHSISDNTTTSAALMVFGVGIRLR